MLVDSKLVDDHFDRFRQRVCRPDHVEGADDHVHHAAEIANAFGCADEHDRQRRGDLLGCGDALQVGVDHAARDRIALHVADQRGVLGAVVERNFEQLVLAPAVEQFVERSRVDFDREGRLAVAVERAGNAARFAHRRRCGRAGSCAGLDDERRVCGSHDSF